MVYFDRSEVIGWFVNRTGQDVQDVQASVIVKGTNCLAVMLWWTIEDGKSLEAFMGFFNDFDHVKRYAQSTDPHDMSGCDSIYLYSGYKYAKRLGAIFAKYGTSVIYYDDPNYAPNIEHRSASRDELKTQRCAE